MEKMEAAKGPGFLQLFMLNKHWYLGAVLFFLAAAFFYIQKLSPKYLVSSKITVNRPASVSPDELKAPGLLRRTLDRLPFRVDYYREGPDGLVELPMDSLPVKVLTGKNARLNTDTKLELAITSARQFQVTEDDTISSYRFNEAINQPFGQFRVIIGPAFSLNTSPTVLKFNDESQLLENYKDNLDVETGDDGNTLLLSVKVDHPQKGIDFLNRLLQVYGDSHALVTVKTTAPSPIPAVAGPEHVTKPEPVAVKQPVVQAAKTKVITDTIITTKMVAAKVNQDSVKLIKGEIAGLQVKADRLDRQVAKDKGQAKIIISEDAGLPKDPQLRTLIQMQNYVKSPVNQFVQVPNADKIKDDDLKELVQAYNKMQRDKQPLLSDSATNSGRISAANRQLTQLKTDILENLNIQTTEEDDRDPLEMSKYTSKKTAGRQKHTVNVPAYAADKQLLEMADKELQAKRQLYVALIKPKIRAEIVKAIVVRPVKQAPAPVKPAFVKIAVVPAKVSQSLPAPAVTATRTVKAFTVISKPENNIEAVYPSSIIYYLLALIFGIITATLVVYAKNVLLAMTWNRLFDFKKLNERLANMFNKPEID